MSWKTLGVSVIGTSHIKIGKPCQDSRAIFTINKDCLVGIVADGLGSAERSEIGSQLVVKTVREGLEGALKAGYPDSDTAWHDLLAKVFSQARTALENEAANLACELRELGTTLIFFVVVQGTIAVAQIGDGAVVIQFADDQMITISSPQRGEFANETIPLTMEGALEKVCYHIQPAQIKNIAALSDGLQNLALITANYQPFEPFFTPLFKLVENSTDLEASAKKVEEFLSSSKVTGRTDDDKSLLIATSSIDDVVSGTAVTE